MIIGEHILTKKAANVYSTLGASNHAAGDRAVLDFYETDPRAIEALIDNVKDIYHNVLEPAAGLGAIVEPLRKAGHKVYTTDIKQYPGYELDQTINFYDLTREQIPFEHFDIVTNPPYCEALKFLEHALNILKEGERCYMFLRLQFLEGLERGKFFKTNPPRFVYVFSRRVSCKKAGLQDKPSGAVAFAWFIFEKGYKGEPAIRWLLND